MNVPNVEERTEKYQTTRYADTAVNAQKRRRPQMPRKKLTVDEYQKRLQKNNPKIIVIGQYTDTSTQVMLRCMVCYHEWFAFPNAASYGSGCKVCSYENRKGKPIAPLNHATYVKAVAETSPVLQVVGNYTHSHVKILHQCRLCGHERLIAPYAAMKRSGVGCTKCKRKKL